MPNVDKQRRIGGRPFDANGKFDPTALPDPEIKTLVPDLSEAVEGWRCWKVPKQLPNFGLSPKMYSVVHNYYWTPKRAAEAVCDKERCFNSKAQPWDGEGPDARMKLPGQGCHCGFYSAKDRDHLMTMQYHFYDDGAEWFTVMGQVANWGKVIEGTLGWRAQFSYPKKLFLPWEHARFLTPLQRGYGVPVVLENFGKRPKEEDLLA